MNERLQKYLTILYSKCDFDQAHSVIQVESIEGAYDPLEFVEEDFILPHTLNQKGSHVKTLPKEEFVATFDTFVSAFDNIENVELKCQEHLI